MLGIGLFAVFLLALLTQGLGGWRALRIGAHLVNNRPHDISHLGIAVAPRVGPVLQSLLAVGLQRLGEIQTGVGGRGVPTWLMTSPDGTTVAEVASLGADVIIAFSSAFDDGSVVETRYPFGEDIALPEFQSHTVSESPLAAYAFHTQQVAQTARMTGRTLQPVTGMDLYLTLDAAYRERHTAPLLKRTRRIALVQVAAGAYAVAVVALVMARSWLDAATAWTTGVSLLIILLAPAVIISLGSALTARRYR